MKTDHRMANDVRAKAAELLERLRGLSVQDLQYVISHECGSPARLALTRKSALKGYESALKAFRASEAKEDARAEKPLVAYSNKLRQEARRLQMEIARKQGILEERLALAKLKGERIDPFPDDTAETDRPKEK